MRIIDQLLSYHENLERRELSSIEMVVIHCTELPTLEMAKEFGERILYPDGTGNSGHYYIDRDGTILRYVPDHRIARHVVGQNRNSIGIELVNLGRYPNWFYANNQTCTQSYPKSQIESVKNLLEDLRNRYPQIKTIARHSDLDLQWIAAEDDPSVRIRRKIDPGPLFPWEEILDWWNTLGSKQTK